MLINSWTVVLDMCR